MNEQTPPHEEQSVWEQVRPQDSKGWLYLIGGLLLIVLIIGGMCLYLPAFFAGL